MSGTVEARLLIVETSGRVGQVALAQGKRVVGVRRLDEARRHARDLAPATKDLLEEQGWRPRDIHGVIVSRGPGSYTGLRVGIMSAKAFAYATGCALVAVDTCAAIARQALAEALRVDVLADAQQDKVYVQRFGRSSPGQELLPQLPLAIRQFAVWLAGREKDVWVTGPFLHGREGRLPAGTPLVEAGRRDPTPQALLEIGLERYLRGEKDDLWVVEPLYLRPSAAEEQMQNPKSQTPK